MLRRLSTNRVRSPTCTIDMLRSSPSLMSWLLRPSAFAVLGKSNAIRAGWFTVKLAGAALSACLVVTRMITFPPWDRTLNASIAFCGAAWACASPAQSQAAAATSSVMMGVLYLLISSPP
jgi:hypothetical protein